MTVLPKEIYISLIKAWGGANDKEPIEQLTDFPQFPRALLFLVKELVQMRAYYAQTRCYRRNFLLLKSVQNAKLLGIGAGRRRQAACYDPHTTKAYNQRARGSALNFIYI